MSAPAPAGAARPERLCERPGAAGEDGVGRGWARRTCCDRAQEGSR